MKKKTKQNSCVDKIIRISGLWQIYEPVDVWVLLNDAGWHSFGLPRVQQRPLLFPPPQASSYCTWSLMVDGSTLSRKLQFPSVQWNQKLFQICWKWRWNWWNKTKKSYQHGLVISRNVPWLKNKINFDSWLMKWLIKLNNFNNF